MLHFPVKVVAFAGALAHAAEHGDASVLFSDVVDELLDDDGLADAGAAEEADLAALHIGFEQIENLNAGLEDLRRGLLVYERRRSAVDGRGRLRLDGAL